MTLGSGDGFQDDSVHASDQSEEKGRGALQVSVQNVDVIFFVDLARLTEHKNSESWHCLFET